MLTGSVSPTAFPRCSPLSRSVHRPCSVIREEPSEKGLEERKHRFLLFPLPCRIVTSPLKGILEAFQQRCLMRLHMRAALLALQDA
jgi:hypothetical protein